VKRTFQSEAWLTPTSQDPRDLSGCLRQTVPCSDSIRRHSADLQTMVLELMKTRARHLRIGPLRAGDERLCSSRRRGAGHAATIKRHVPSWILVVPAQPVVLTESYEWQPAA
jgi:hypothetical protein